jgi:hypothetical protein
MKFYKNNNFNICVKAYIRKQTMICQDYPNILFYKNGKYSNNKNAAYIDLDIKFKEFWLDGKPYGNKNDFTKQSWRKFVKLQAFT